MIVILFGPPGSGKGTQAHNLEAKEGFLHISTGNLLRDAVAQGTEIGLRVKEILASGKLVSDQIVADLLRDAVLHAKTDRIVLDGFPRTLEQVAILDDLLRSLKRSIDLVVSLEVENALLIERMTGRFSCKGCGSGYHRSYKKTILANVCDICGGAEFLIREDDRMEVVSQRIDVYLQQTLPILSIYRDRGIVKTLDGALTTDHVFQGICSSLRGLVS